MSKFWNKQKILAAEFYAMSILSRMRSSIFIYFFYTLHWWFTYYFRWYTVEIHTVLVVQIFKVSVLKISVYLTTGLLKFLSFLTQKIIKKGTKAQEKTKSIKNVCKNTSNISIKFYCFIPCFIVFNMIHMSVDDMPRGNTFYCNLAIIFGIWIFSTSASDDVASVITNIQIFIFINVCTYKWTILCR